MLFRLALRCGLPHPDHLLRCLSSRQLSELYAFVALEPVDEGIQTLAAQWFSMYANAHRDEKAQPVKPQDFLRDYNQAKESTDEQNSDALYGLLRHLED